jgi:hypothetical protein
MKEIKLMKWDNCYTFVLKVLDKFIEYMDIPSDEFVAIHKPMPIPDTLMDWDIIVWDSPDKEVEMDTARQLLSDGRILHNRIIYYRYHFGVYWNGYVYDLSFDNEVNYIRVRDREDIRHPNLKVIRLG